MMASFLLTNFNSNLLKLIDSSKLKINALLLYQLNQLSSSVIHNDVMKKNENRLLVKNESKANDDLPKNEPKKVKFQPLGITNLDLKETDEATASQWHRVYAFPLITWAAMFCRAKLYQTVIVTVYVPISLVSYYYGQMSLDNLLFYMQFFTFSTITLYIIGNLFKRLVGSVYLSDDGTKTQIAHLTFWGKRNDQIFDTSDFVHLKEINTMNELYMRVERMSSEQPFYIVLKYGGILNKEKFQKIFGSLD